VIGVRTVPPGGDVDLRVAEPKRAADVRVDHPQRAHAVEGLVQIGVAVDPDPVGDQRGARPVVGVVRAPVRRARAAGAQPRPAQRQVALDVRTGQRNPTGGAERLAGLAIPAAQQVSADVQPVAVQRAPVHRAGHRGPRVAVRRVSVHRRVRRHVRCRGGNRADVHCGHQLCAGEVHVAAGAQPGNAQFADRLQPVGQQRPGQLQPVGVQRAPARVVQPTAGQHQRAVHPCVGQVDRIAEHGALTEHDVVVRRGITRPQPRQPAAVELHPGQFRLPQVGHLVEPAAHEFQQIREFHGAQVQRADQEPVGDAHHRRHRGPPPPGQHPAAVRLDDRPHHFVHRQHRPLRWVGVVHVERAVVGVVLDSRGHPCLLTPRRKYHPVIIDMPSYR
jgi:hypothetical protein